MRNMLVQRVHSARLADRLAAWLESPGIPAALRTRLIRQFHRPAGTLGHLSGWIMANRSSNVDRNRWAVGQLDVRPTDHVLEIASGPGSPSRRWRPGSPRASSSASTTRR